MQLDHDSGVALVITNNMSGCILFSFPFGTNITGAWESVQLPCRVLIQVSPQGITKKVETHIHTHNPSDASKINLAHLHSSATVCKHFANSTLVWIKRE
uniref:Uncharacterized protein n=1 Tax=Rhipicephalus zambeziensis TaxID=60191 RepID=A0A224YHK7_9ACAR